MALSVGVLVPRAGAPGVVPVPLPRAAAVCELSEFVQKSAPKMTPKSAPMLVPKSVIDAAL